MLTSIFFGSAGGFCSTWAYESSLQAVEPQAVAADAPVRLTLCRWRRRGEAEKGPGGVFFFGGYFGMILHQLLDFLSFLFEIINYIYGLFVVLR